MHTLRNVELPSPTSKQFLHILNACPELRMAGVAKAGTKCLFARSKRQAWCMARDALPCKIEREQQACAAMKKGTYTVVRTIEYSSSLRTTSRLVENARDRYK
jgi:hypothetical protein